jgi:hypothetical protein
MQHPDELHGAPYARTNTDNHGQCHQHGQPTGGYITGPWVFKSYLLPVATIYFLPLVILVPPS